MSDQNSIFNNQNSSGETPPNNAGGTQQTSQTPDPVADLLGQIKNEKGEPKYKNVQEALNGLLHAQQFIETLKSEKNQLGTEVNELRTVANQVTELKSVVEKLTQGNTPAPSATPATTGLTEEQIAALVQNTLTKQQQAEIASRNISAVRSTVQAAFGEKAEETFYTRAAELGMSKEEVNALAARTPAAVLRMLGLDDKKALQTNQATTSSINTSGITPTQETYISRPKNRLPVGATHNELMSQAQEARKMVEELHAKGMSIDDLTKPSEYFKHFK